MAGINQGKMWNKYGMKQEKTSPGNRDFSGWAKKWEFHGKSGNFHLEAPGVEGSGTLRGRAEPQVQTLHEPLGVAHVLQVPERPQIQHLHGLRDVLHLGWSSTG